MPERTPDMRIPPEYLAKIRALAVLDRLAPPRTEFLHWSDPEEGLACYYAPFEYINTEAKLILIGITPGKTQMNLALNAARRSDAAGTPLAEAIRALKRESSFGGPMRPLAIKMLDKLGIAERFGLNSSSQLWGDSDHLVHFCSLLKYPVFLTPQIADYNGKPPPFGTPSLERMVIEHFVPMLKSITPQALLVPFGDTVLDVVARLKKKDLIEQNVMHFEGAPVGPPHPSPLSIESIQLLLTDRYPEKEAFLGDKFQAYKKAQLRDGKSVQRESTYKASRATRWESILRLRRAYEIVDLP